MTTSDSVVPVQLTVRGEVPARSREYVTRKVQHVMASAHAPVLQAHAIITVEHDPALERPARVEVGLDVNGTPVRAHVTAPDVHQAADLVEDRLRRRLVHLQDRQRTRHRWIGIAAEHEWRRGDLPRQPLAYYPRPVEEREIVRRKTLALEPMTADEAAHDMDLLDHDFYLFIDADTRRPAVVAHSPDGYVLYGKAAQGAGARVGVPLIVDGPPPVLTEVGARQRLDVSGEPFVFYVDAEDRQARVVYRRYDGHYGVLSAT